MNRAKNSKEGKFLLMEGYMDVISLHQSGFDNAVASLGTAFTPQQAEILKKYADKAVLCYDSDEAGQKATDRAGEILREAGIKGKVLTINSGKDPDEYINSKGAEMFRVLIDNAESFIEYKIHKIEGQYNLDDTVEKIEFIEQIAKVLAGIANRVEREVYIKQISRRTDISVDSITAQVDSSLRKLQVREKAKEERSEKRDYEQRTGGRKDLDKMRLFNAEKLMLNLICEKEVFDRVSQRISAEDFTEGLHRELARVIYGIYEKGERVNPISVISMLGEENIGRVSDILSDDKNVDNKKTAAVMPLKIMEEYKLRRQEESSADSGDTAKLQEIMEQLKKDKR